MASELIGTQLDHYFLLSRIGAGGSAAIYRAHDAREDRYVALKVLPHHFAENDELYQRFAREAQMAARLTHPHILPVYDYGEAEGIPYIAMRLVDGGTLDDFVREGPLPLPFITRVLGDIASALDYAHARGVIHRDLKPDNILFDAEGTLYLGDFGVAHLEDDAGAQTGPAEFTGTVAYASPEQCRGEELTPTSDLYALGVVVYEMLTGTLPFQGSTPLAVMRQHLTEPVPDPHKANPALLPGVTAVLDKALAKRPSARFRSAASFSGALNRALYSQPDQSSVERIALAASARVAAPPASAPDAIHFQVTRRLLAVVALLAAIIAVASALILTLAR